jgi:hypothetical protein
MALGVVEQFGELTTKGRASGAHQAAGSLFGPDCGQFGNWICPKLDKQ